MSTTESATCIERRAVLQAGAAVGVAGLLGSVPTLSVADTGYHELSATATVPTNTGLAITVHESVNGAENSETIYVKDGTQTYLLADLERSVDDAADYWFDITLTSSEYGSTPELDSLELAIPDGSGTDSDDKDEDGSDAELVDESSEGGFFIFGGGDSLFSFDFDWWPFGDDGDNRDDDDGLFSFDFDWWPFSDDKDGNN
ncbi:hypothetical protein [Natronobacterium lacisalsi]|uniref:hypothetical protein n=1 Tax=Natronobacterium lacisalsi TaxID=229731 RepID=UPI001269160B|nr:hypothetical protein [Halobiforma lacisalsi]